MKRIVFILALYLMVQFACKPSTEQSTSQADTLAQESMPKVSAEEQALIDGYSKLFGVLPSKAENAANPSSEAKIALGKQLYFDARLSKSGNISCNSCHNLASYGVDNLPVSLGHKWQKGVRNSPTTLNAALHFVQFWDGREPDVEAQAKGPETNPIEMGAPHPQFVVDRLKSIPEYQQQFDAVFAGDSVTLTYDNMAKAIGAFERTLLTPSRFDAYLAGDAQAITADEKKGIETFKAVGCTTCHIGPLLGGNMFQKFGLVKPFTTYKISNDLGKAAVTKNEADKYMFKVPSLRNSTRTYPYFHDGSIWNLEQAIRIMADTQLGKQLTDPEVRDITNFMATL
ncbi:MAG: Cpx [Bacteroidota bacterium]